MSFGVLVCGAESKTIVILYLIDNAPYLYNKINKKKKKKENDFARVRTGDRLCVRQK